LALLAQTYYGKGVNTHAHTPFYVIEKRGGSKASFLFNINVFAFVCMLLIIVQYLVRTIVYGDKESSHEEEDERTRVHIHTMSFVVRDHLDFLDVLAGMRDRREKAGECECLVRAPASSRLETRLDDSESSFFVPAPDTPVSCVQNVNSTFRLRLRLSDGTLEKTRIPLAILAQRSSFASLLGAPDLQRHRWRLTVSAVGAAVHS